ncbi:hypothetical protein [Ilumatobacter sp.]|uniref:hypothetical protein n=1 Tax=Ilumatobacter sp. TaxID=1967498 RepID=UPI003AF9F630
MDVEPRNLATEVTRRSVGWLNDRDFVAREGETMVSPDFVRYDHRRVVAQPPAGPKDWVAGLFAWEEITGEWPTYELSEILAVRGDRTCACRWVMHFGDFEAEYVVVNASDRAGERFATIRFYDPEDIDEAMAELDRLHAEIEADDEEQTT